MFGKLQDFSQISDIAMDAHLVKVTSNDRERRALVPIAVIDDETFTPEQNLRALSYDIRALGDIKSLDEVGPYNIILCDLQGVGRHMSLRGQGAFIIDELKRNHPEKFVIAYTGGSPDDAITLKAQEVADTFITKDADIDEWRDKLDSVISFLSDPVRVWKRQRIALIDADVPTLDILKLEDAFVRSIKIGSDYGFRSFVSNSVLRADARAIAQSLIASGIFKLLVG